MAQLNFNAASVAPQESYDILPAGWYNARITGSEMKPTKDGTGSYLSLTMTVIDGLAANRKIFDRLNLNNKNPKAVEIAYQTLSSICHATGVINLQDSTQLHGIPLSVKVKVRPAEGQYGESNEVAGYRKVEGVAPAVPSFVAPAAQAPSFNPQATVYNPVMQQAASSAPPWAK